MFSANVVPEFWRVMPAEYILDSGVVTRSPGSMPHVVQFATIILHKYKTISLTIYDNIIYCLNAIPFVFAPEINKGVQRALAPMPAK